MDNFTKVMSNLPVIVNKLLIGLDAQLGFFK